MPYRWTRNAIALIAISSLAMAPASRVAFAWGHSVTDPKTGELLLLNTTKASDLIGRWTLTTVSYGAQDGTDHLRLDVVRCGPDLCGIKLSDQGECRQLILRVKDNGRDKAIMDGDNPSNRYTGILDWPDKVARYYVAIDILGADSDLDTSDPATRRLVLNGYPASNGVPDSFGSRIFPISAAFANAGSPACPAPSS